MAQDWFSKIDTFGKAVLESLGVYSAYDIRDRNPITEALKDQGFVNRWGGYKEFNFTSVSLWATICQMIVYDRSGGPEGDRQAKGLRRAWYHWYKVNLAQPLSIQLGNEDPNEANWGTRWAARLSTTYAWMVDNLDVTYRDLWVEDASRMMEALGGELFKRANVVVAVEKDSLYSDFVAPAKALGAKAIFSGKGKMSKAAIEKALRDFFQWPDGNYDFDTGEYLQPFDWDHPLVILHITDHDYDGEAVIGPTFGEQARRYTPHVEEARVGIKPWQVEDTGGDLNDVIYQVKLSNAGYQTWAEEKALFLGECLGCGKTYVVQGIDQEGKYTPCCGAAYVTLEVSKTGDVAHGLEVEAVSTRAYRRYIVEALLEVMDFDHIIDQLRQEATADAWEAAHELLQDVLDNNPDYQRLLAEYRRLERIKRDFEERITASLQDVGQPFEGAFADEGEDPEEEHFVEHVQAADRWSGPWRPFDRANRTALLIDYLVENQIEELYDFINEEIEF